MLSIVILSLLVVIDSDASEIERLAIILTTPTSQQSYLSIDIRHQIAAVLRTSTALIQDLQEERKQNNSAMMNAASHALSGQQQILILESQIAQLRELWRRAEENPANNPT